MEISVPFVPTDPAGWPRKPFNSALSAEYTPHGWTDGCCLKSVNQSHAPRPRVPVTSTAARTNVTKELSRTVHLHRSTASQDGFGVLQLLGSAPHPDTVLVVAEASVVADGHRDARDARADEQPGDGGQPADEHHQLEREDRIGNPGRDRLAAHDQRPVLGAPDGDPVAGDGAEQAADQRELAHRTDRPIDGVRQLVTGGRREDRDLARAILLQRLDGVDRRVDFLERAKHALHHARPPAASGAGSPPCSSAHLDTGARRGGTSSFTSALAITSNCRMNSRNHMKNQPNDPIRIE